MTRAGIYPGKVCPNHRVSLNVVTEDGGPAVEIELAFDQALLMAHWLTTKRNEAIDQRGEPLVSVFHKPEGRS